MNFSFSPNSLTVKVGTKVTWTNHDSVTHTVTSNQGTFNSSVPPGSNFSFTFTKAGTYAYHCNIHPYIGSLWTRVKLSCKERWCALAQAN